jgi:hypothetical protein
MITDAMQVQEAAARVNQLQRDFPCFAAPKLASQLEDALVTAAPGIYYTEHTLVSLLAIARIQIQNLGVLPVRGVAKLQHCCTRSHLSGRR